MQNKVLSMSKYLRPIIYVKMVNISLGTIHKTKTIQEIVCERIMYCMFSSRVLPNLDLVLDHLVVPI